MTDPNGGNSGSGGASGGRFLAKMKAERRAIFGIMRNILWINGGDLPDTVGRR